MEEHGKLDERTLTEAFGAREEGVGEEKKK